jgi:hypothetical protein
VRVKHLDISKLRLSNPSVLLKWQDRPCLSSLLPFVIETGSIPPSPFNSIHIIHLLLSSFDQLIQLSIYTNERKPKFHAIHQNIKHQFSQPNYKPLLVTTKEDRMLKLTFLFALHTILIIFFVPTDSDTRTIFQIGEDIFHVYTCTGP